VGNDTCTACAAYDAGGGENRTVGSGRIGKKSDGNETMRSERLESIVFINIELWGRDGNVKERP